MKNSIIASKLRRGGGNGTLKCAEALCLRCKDTTQERLSFSHLARKLFKHTISNKSFFIENAFFNISSPDWRGWRVASGEGLNKTVARIIGDLAGVSSDSNRRAGSLRDTAQPLTNDTQSFVRQSPKFGFTLAEVLITLGIIGVVAAMTLPTLIQRQQEKVIVSKLKKNYSVMQQAYLMAVKDKGTPDLWGLTNNLLTDNDDVDDTNNFLYHMREYLKITKYCGGEAEGCWANTKALNGGSFNLHEDQRRYSKALLADGSNILTYVSSADCTARQGAIKDVCGIYRIDINGKTPPNAMGRDVFTFWITKTRLIPLGTEQDGGFNTNCRDAKTHLGRSCTAWVIYNENMDYLHCSDLSWKGKRKCKG